MLVVVVVGEVPTINNYYNELAQDGSWRFGYETSNNIYVQESGVGGKGSQGSVAYYAPDGTPIQLTWTADENGFRPLGSHLPTPPPVPIAPQMPKTIMNALDYQQYHQKAQQLLNPAQKQADQQPQQSQQQQVQYQQYQQQYQQFTA